ncbi:MAG: hypothetical protein ACREM9_07525 [Gemmatimonadales bacterium]
MISRRALGSIAVAASMCLLPACDLLPDRPQPAFEAQPPADTAGARRPQARSRRDTARKATGAEADAAFGQIRRSLRVLVAAEEGFYAENGTYSEDLARLGYRPSGESQVRFLWLTRRGWAASGTHPALPGMDCVTFVGVADAPPATLRYTRSGREGVVICDAQPRPRPAAGGAAPAPSSAARPAPSSPAVADTASALDAVNPVVRMKVDLRNLVPAQTAYFGTQGVYSRRIEQLQLQYGWHRGVRVTLLQGDQHSWSARATHADRPGKSCVVWYGSPSTRPATQAQRKVPEREGVPVCDD